MRSIVHISRPGHKLMLLAAGALLAVAFLQRPSMLLGLLTPKGMAATTVRIFAGFLLACLVQASFRQPGWQARRFVATRSRNLAPLALMLTLLAFMYVILGGRAFGGLRLDDLVMRRACFTQVLALALLWLRLLK
jgi:hypothetical protein